MNYLERIFRKLTDGYLSRVVAGRLERLKPDLIVAIFCDGRLYYSPVRATLEPSRGPYGRAGGRA